MNSINVVNYLNQYLTIETQTGSKGALASLIKVRVPVSSALADSEQVIVYSENNQNSLGFLGMLNTLLGMDSQPPIYYDSTHNRFDLLSNMKVVIN